MKLRSPHEYSWSTLIRSNKSSSALIDSIHNVYKLEQSYVMRCFQTSVVSASGVNLIHKSIESMCVESITKLMLYIWVLLILSYRARFFNRFCHFFCRIWWILSILARFLHLHVCVRIFFVSLYIFVISSHTFYAHPVGFASVWGGGRERVSEPDVVYLYI